MPDQNCWRDTANLGFLQSLPDSVYSVQCTIYPEEDMIEAEMVGVKEDQVRN